MSILVNPLLWTVPVVKVDVMCIWLNLSISCAIQWCLIYHFATHLSYATDFLSVLFFNARQHTAVYKARLSYVKSICPSVRLSACPDVTRWFCVETTANIIELFSPPGRTVFFSFFPQLKRRYRFQTEYPHLGAGTLNICGIRKIYVFLLVSPLISEMVQVRSTVTIDDWSSVPDSAQSFPMTLSDL